MISSLGDGSLLSEQETLHVPLWNNLHRFVIKHKNRLTMFSSFIVPSWFLSLRFTDVHLSLVSADQPKFRSSIDQGTELVRLFVPGTGGGGEEVLVCQELWDMAAANVACKEDGHPL